ncbi:MAG: SulP family inorganic anion transporter, partial [Chromatiaceae bacterium]|nr:SulP family inorganic anion transporter [Chromatiaceae bacterium]
RHAPKAGVTMMLVVLVMTVFVDLIIAVATGMVMASMVFMKRHSDLQLQSIKTIREVDEDTPLSQEEAEIFRAAQGRILLVHLGGPMSFGAAKGMARLLAQFDEYDSLILELTDMPQIDFTASRALFDMVTDAKSMGREVFLVGTRKPVQEMLTKQGIIAEVPAGHRVEKRLAALQEAQRLLRAKQA